MENEKTEIAMRGEKDRLLSIAGVAVLFMVCFFFFVEAHPLVPYDTDDWLHLSQMRNVALPKWGDWNPIKVLPETLMPISGTLAAYAVQPFVGDYLRSLTVMSAFVVSGFITAYVALFYAFIRKAFSLPQYQALTVSAMFFLFHFLLFRSHDDANAYLFYSMSLTCYYNYLLPALLNAAMVLYFLYRQIHGSHRLGPHPGKNGWFIFALFLAIFSNVLLSIILVAWLLADMLLEWRGARKARAGFFGWLRGQGFYLAILGAWLLSLLFESHGGRSHQIGTGLLGLPIGETLAYFFDFLIGAEKGLLIFLAAMVLFMGSAALPCRHAQGALDRAYRGLLQRLFLSMGIWFFYIVPLCAAAEPSYAGRTDVLFGLFFYLLLACFSSAAYALSKRPRLYHVAPILLLVILSRTMRGQEPLMTSPTSFGYPMPPETCVAIDHELIGQVQAAVQDDEELVLRVPVGGGDDNWPHPPQAAQVISDTLYRHGVIPHLPKKASTLPDGEMNLRYRLSMEEGEKGTIP